MEGERGMEVCTRLAVCKAERNGGIDVDMCAGLALFKVWGMEGERNDVPWTGAEERGEERERGRRG